MKNFKGIIHIVSTMFISSFALADTVQNTSDKAPAFNRTKGNVTINYYGQGESITKPETKLVRKKEDSSQQQIARKSYSDDKKGTITDQQTELMWKKCSEGQRFDVKKNTCTRFAKIYTWKEASKIFSKTNTFAGYSDWRLPDNRELITLIWCSNGVPSIEAAYGCDGKKNDKGEYQSPTIDLKYFPNTEVGGYISSTITSHEGKKHYWVRWFGSGGMYGAPDKKIKANVRLVRFISP